jgi:hypothetical protein
LATNESVTTEEALEVSDSTGVSDVFALTNRQELFTPFEVADPTDISPQVPEPKVPTRVEAGLGSGVFESDEARHKGLFEKLFGYNPESNLPYGYEKMSELERTALKAQLAAQNVFTRFGLGAEKQSKGFLQLILPESAEQFLVSDKEIKEGRVPEDQYYEARQQSELRDKKRDIGLSVDEEEQLQYLNEILPGKLQRTPEALGRVAAEIEKIALSGEIFGAIKIPGGGNLSQTLSKKGKEVLGSKLSVLAAKFKDAPMAQTAINTLAKQMVSLGPNVGELFTWGVISAEKDEEGEAERLKAGAKMTGWAALPVILAPAGKVIAQTKAGQVTAEFLQNAVAKTVSPLADKLAAMGARQAKDKFIKQAVVESDDLFFKTNQRYMTAAEKDITKKALVETAEEVSKIVQKDAATITKRIEELAATQTGKKPVGIESVIPDKLRVVETVGDDVINNTTKLVESRTRFASVRQPNGNYAIIDKETFHEVSVNIKRKDLAKELNNAIFGVPEKVPAPTRALLPKKIRTRSVITEETELKRSLKRMETATNKAFRAGAKDANEKALIKIQNANERLATLKAGNRQQWENVEYARQLVKDFVPKQDQHLFMNRIIKARTEGGMNQIFDDIGKHVDVAKVKNSVDSIRSAMKEAQKKYRDKTGKFAKAPDEIRPLLERLDKASENITKISQKTGANLDDMKTLANEMISGLNETLAGKGEVLGIPAGLSEDLYNLTAQQGDNITADTVETIAQLTRTVIHRAEQAHLIDIGGEVALASKAIDDSISSIVPRKITPRVETQRSRFKDLFGADSDHPITLVEKMFGNDSSMRVLLDDLYEGEIKAFGVMRNSYSMVKEYIRTNNISDDVFDNLKTNIDVKIGGKSVNMTKDEALSIVMSTRDPWLFDQMTKTSGFEVAGVRTGRATVDELAEITARMSPEEMKLGAMFFNLNDNYLSQVVNETSIHLNGTKIATYPQYYPSHRKLGVRLHGNKFGVATAETQSQFMPRMGGTGTMRFNSYSRELMDYIQNASMYNGTATPMRSIKTVLSDKTLQDSLQKAGYGKELSNFADILSKSEGMYADNSVLDLIGSNILNKFTKGILGGRVSTIGTQMASVPAAKTVVPGKYFKATDTLPGSGAIDDLMNSDFFWHRWTGRRVSVELGDSASKSSLSHFISGKTPLTEKPLSGLVWGDKQAAGKIYLASKRFLRDTTKLKGTELKESAIKLTEKAFRETQPNWSVLTRSKLASDPSVFKRSMTMFRTAQEAQLNIIKRANGTFARSAKSAKDVKVLKDSYKAVLESQMSVALWKTLWKTGKNAGISGVAGWLGVYSPQNEDPFAGELTKQSARAVAGTVPLGQLVESTVEQAIDKLIGEGGSINTSVDPISTVFNVSTEAIGSIAKWVNKYVDSNAKREGFTSNFTSVTLDDILDDISTSKADKEQKKVELRNQIEKDILKAIRATGLITGLPVGPLDEWISPGLRRSPFSQVTRINDNNSSDPASLQRDLHKFLTRQKELEDKEEKKGLTKEEAQQAFLMKTFKKSRIDAFFAVDDVVGDRQQGLLDQMAEPLSGFVEQMK